MSFLNFLTSLGTDHTENSSEKRSIFLANTLSLVLASTGYVIFFIYLGYYGPSEVTFAIPAISLVSLAPLLFNHLGLPRLAQVWMSLFTPVAIITLSIVSKTIYYESAAELDYFSFRIIILSCCIFPPIFFSLRDKWLLFFTSSAILLILLLHDPLHSFFDVPYRGNPLKESNYSFMNVVFFFMYVITTGAVIFMKSISEKNENRANKLIDELNITNQKLFEKNKETEEQNTEITKYINNLDISQKKLTDAYKIIEEQRNLLFVQNKNLSTELLEKNTKLTETNNELIKHNNELRQFSYTVSHNLRGPVASLMGLLKLFRTEGLDEDNLDIFRHIETSTVRLDNIIKDLSKIIDIRNDIFQIRQQINLPREISDILQELEREISAQSIQVRQHHASNGIIYSVRPMVHSIIYNLVSNAIKYRSPDRESVIEINTSEDKRFYYIEVRDNGLGIDLNRDQDNLFKLYKRFHHHTEGKGLGLYLVKLQAEALGGTITVESELNRYSHFTVRLRKPENAERQILLEESSFEVFFDATLNTIGLSLKRIDENPSIVLGKIIEFLKVYETPNFVADLSALPESGPQPDHSVLMHIVRESGSSGLKRIAVVTKEGDINTIEGLKDLLIRYKITLRFVPETTAAFSWIQAENLR